LKTWAEVMSTGKKEFKCRKLEVEFKQGEMWYSVFLCVPRTTIKLLYGTWSSAELE
jgi:hypothetical protein